MNHKPSRDETSQPSPHRACDLDYRNRENLFRIAEGQIFDLVIIGAGITGAGIAREAAGRGLTVAVVEARDLASGTSSRSSKMIHGGVRYLAQGDVALVRESARERQILRRIAPHLARLTPFLLPTRTARGLAKFRTAMWTFEKLGQIPKAEHHRVWNRSDLQEKEPTAAVESATGGVVYFEFLTDDARLTLANARSAAGDGALVLTYAPVRGVLLEQGRAVGVRCQGTLPGEALEAIVRGRQIVNAAGPWVDAIRALEDPAAPPKLSLTKGVHVVVPHERLPLARTVLMNAADRRPVFAVPRQHVTYVGTTDTFHAQSDRWPEITAADADYLFEAAERSFTTRPLKLTDVVSSWSGIRPLVSQKGKSPSEISRRDEVWVGPGGILSIAGGKLTAYRAMAQRVVDRVAEQLGAPSRQQDQSRPLIGGDFSAPAPDPDAIAESTQEGRLLELYGSEATDVRGDSPAPSLEAEVRQAVLREGALRLEDFWIRRSGRAHFDVDAGLKVLDRASSEMARLLDWSEQRCASERAACHDLHQTNNAVFLEGREPLPPGEPR